MSKFYLCIEFSRILQFLLSVHNGSMGSSFRLPIGCLKLRAHQVPEVIKHLVLNSHAHEICWAGFFIVRHLPIWGLLYYGQWWNYNLYVNFPKVIAVDEFCWNYDRAWVLLIFCLYVEKVWMRMYCEDIHFHSYLFYICYHEYGLFCLYVDIVEIISPRWVY